MTARQIIERYALRALLLGAVVGMLSIPWISGCAW